MKPTLEEVKEYFKDAEIVESIYGTQGIPTGNFHFENDCYFCETENGTYLALWKERKGYAKILTYKNPKFEITKEQVLELHRHGHDLTRTQLEGVFPEVFKKPFTGWAKDTCCCNKLWITYFENGLMKYGIDSRGYWFIKENPVFEFSESDTHKEATPQEVEDALIGEAKKRGFVNGAFFNDLHYKSFSGKVDIVRWEEDSQDLRSGGYCIFHNGIWATIIQPKKMTQSEIEKELGYKIDIV